MRLIAVAWGILALAGIALSVVAIARLPSADRVDALMIAFVLVICNGGFLSLWFILREWWPQIREWQIGYRMELGWCLTVFVPIFGFAVIVATLTDTLRQPIAGPFRLSALFTVSVLTLSAFWTFRPNLNLGHGLLRLIVIVATVTCLAVLMSARQDLGVAGPVGIVGSLALCVATLWQLRSSRHT